MSHFYYDAVAILVCGVVGVAVMVANPGRSLNQAFVILSAIVGGWMLATTGAGLAVVHRAGLIRVSFMIGGFIPWAMWLVKEAASGERLIPYGLYRSWRWLTVGVILLIDSALPRFLGESSGDSVSTTIGWGIFNGVLLLALLILGYQTFRAILRAEGGQRLELQLVALGAICGGFVGEGTILAGGLLSIPELRHAAVLPVIAFYAGTAYVVTSRSIFDARFLFQVTGRWILWLLTVAGIIELSNLNAIRHGSSFIISLAIGAIVLLILSAVNRISWMRPRLTLEESTSRTRRALRDLDETLSVDEIVSKAGRILADWAGAERAAILVAQNGSYRDGTIEIPCGSAMEKHLLAAGGETPVSLARQRPVGAIPDFVELLRKHRIGAIVTPHRGDRLPTLLTAIGQRVSHRPFTKPELQTLEDLVGIVDGLVKRAESWRKVKDSERLATAGLLGLSMSHEIRNATVTLKTLSQLPAQWNDERYQRMMRDIVPVELDRITRMVNVLMDLGKPPAIHFAPVHFDGLVSDAVRFLNPKAITDNVRLTTELNSGIQPVMIDQDSVKQILFNLALNAIQAASTATEGGQVKIITSRNHYSLTMHVWDNGRPIPSEIRARLFQPFSTAGKSEGMGLGLAVVAEKVRAHRGSIALIDDRPPGKMFEIVLPCDQPAS